MSRYTPDATPKSGFRLPTTRGKRCAASSNTARDQAQTEADRAEAKRIAKSITDDEQSENEAITAMLRKVREETRG